MDMFLRVAHRGAMAYEVENTLRSFTRAIEMGANAIEFDVRASKDGTLVVIHDDNLRRVFGRDAFIKNLSYREIEEISEGLVPRLSDALDLIDKKVERILVEIKDGGTEGAILDEVTKRGLEGRVIFISFLSQAIGGLRGVETGLIYSRAIDAVRVAEGLGCKWILPSYRVLKKDSVSLAHRAGLGVIVWTINDRGVAKKYKGFGVDGIATDRPDILIDI
jgi:glycerophosphoryl diester phosphodiesterase